jgi:hypothetical protein
MVISCRLHKAPNTVATCFKKRLIDIYNARNGDLQIKGVLSGTEDGVSADILRQFQGVMLETNSPRAVDGDGNCLFALQHWQYSVSYSGGAPVGPVGPDECLATPLVGI